TYPETAGLPERLKAQVSCLGNPVRQSFLKTDPASARARLGIPNDAPVLLIFGGSRGARNINEAAIASAGLLLESYPDLHIIHGTGKLEHADVTEKLQQQLSARPQLAVRYHALPYIENMGDVIAASDLVVARAGATSIAELTVLGKPSVLIPYPYATDDHQTTNASALVDLGGARLITDAQIKQWLDNDLSETRSVETFVFAATLVKLMGDEQLRMNMAERAKTLGKADAAKKLADALQKVVAAN
ncbi:MAG: UDP-N-acetylglucosamine--N-acetylmuramyl-(pentapeptide) pyrophosphoryl-undecaprenol N-acetylglucosamine transferase, partial [Coriobacteriia bacterium]|nr:UDP-N-acetylglucosamine--N-acetylmuramyl-(pentapeptide) pyrophosphoryl-undecaprenol N-acetylglucosamine transferase [Coriobacteriia bacterium]